MSRPTQHRVLETAEIRAGVHRVLLTGPLNSTAESLHWIGGDQWVRRVTVPRHADDRVPGSLMAIRVRGQRCPEPGQSIELVPREGVPSLADVVGVIEALLAGQKSRSEVASWAQEGMACMNGAALTTWFWEPRLYAAHLALIGVDWPAQNGDPRRGVEPWFLSTQDLEYWLEVLRGGGEANLAGGWVSTPVLEGQEECHLELTVSVEPSHLEEAVGPGFRLFDLFSHQRCWGLVSPAGFSFLMLSGTETPECGVFWVHCWAPNRQAADPERALRVLAEYLDLPPTGHSGTGQSGASGELSLPRRWEVWRQDDNGNEVRVSQHYGELPAERVAARFQARGHKQDYWVQPSGGGHRR